MERGHEWLMSPSLLQVQKGRQSTAPHPPERHSCKQTGQYYTAAQASYAGQLGGGLGEIGPSGRLPGEGHRITRAGEETGGKTGKLKWA